ncbi:MAG: hypothetical protein J7K66_05315 [Anaerolineaceae bacterium]|nr:hypothetical protein [Anaerolineaceae bacterium]
MEKIASNFRTAIAKSKALGYNGKHELANDGTQRGGGHAAEANCER